ncbi:MAG: hybrid sensor histidine kinase/response regulator [Anaerolineae bacterium]|nr:hybrid sensor histidine kinase/response regulator [Anaerolineae bacterium]
MTRPPGILYIDRDDARRSRIWHALSRAGYQVALAVTALDGMEQAQRARPDLILVEGDLRDARAHHLAARLSTAPGLSGVPIVALTAPGRTPPHQAASAAGLDGWIADSNEDRILVERVEGFLDDFYGNAVTGTAPHAPQDTLTRLETSLRELEASNRALRRLDRIKEDFIQLTAHELRTPLTTVYGYSRLVQTLPAVQELMARDPEVHACLSGLIDSIERFHRAVDEIIVVSRIASDHLDLKRSPTSLPALVERVLHDYTGVAEQRQLALRARLDRNVALFFADTDLLELALSNVLGNAIKYTPDGGTITIYGDIHDDTVILSVQDTGIGIDPDEQEQIFDRFYTAGDTQLHTTSKTAFRGGGLGLGLAICRGIVEAHGGHIWVESEGCDPERLPGSTFVIQLPLERTPPDARR